MRIPHFLAAVESVFVNRDLSNSDRYWFSYKNSFGDIMDVFDTEIILNTLGTRSIILLKDIDKISMINPNTSTPVGCGVSFSTGGAVLSISIDTTSGGKYFDLFPVYKALNRRRVQVRSSPNYRDIAPISPSPS